jgi:tRNA-splicing ligase RtcB
MSEVKKVNANEYVIKKEGKMNTDCSLYLNEKLMKNVEQEAIDQIKNVSTLPGIVGNACAMPDMHSGYGFPIGGVAAFDYKDGCVSPGGIGFDIGCGCRLLTSNVKEKDIEKNKNKILNELFANVPSGVGIDNKEKLSREDFFDLILNGIDWAIKNGFATKKDKECIEDYGRLDASKDFLSQRAVARGLSQIGTLGSGNHFLEVQVVDEVFDKELAKKWGLEKGSLTLMIHTGSRGFGHQIATDFIKTFLDAKNKYALEYPDAQLACVPINSDEGQRYLSSMNCAANFAYVNRQMISFKAREVFVKYGIELDLLYDVAHNIAKKESYKIDGKIKDVLVHRKGATRAFSAGNKILPKKYQSTGQPVILPGSMGTSSYVLVGDKAEEKSFGSVAHGAGRIMSRSSALKNLSYETVLENLHKMNIEIKTQTQKGIVEESPESYKDVDEVVKVLENNKLARAVVKLKPIMVMKG